MHVLPARHPDRALDELAPGRGLPGQRPRRPGDGGRRDRADRQRAGAADPAVRHLLRQPDPRPRAGPWHLQDALRPPWHQHPGDRRAPPARSRSPRRTTGSRSRASRASGSTPRSDRRGSATPARTTAASRACALLDAAGVQRAVPPGGGGRARTTPPTSSTFDEFVNAELTRGRADAQARRPRARAGDRLRADRHRAGRASSTTPAPRPAGCCARRACGSAWSTPTRRRS